MSEVAVFGGTFNPVHLGHTEIVNAVIETGLFDKVFIIPTNVPPHKECTSLAGNSDRLNMCRIAFKDLKNVYVSEIETNREGKSYTFDTVTMLKAQYPSDNFTIVCGGDMAVSLESWYRYPELKSLVSFLFINRSNISGSEFMYYAEKIRNDGAVIKILDAEISDISSTSVRNKIKNGESVSDLLCPAVSDYIKSRGLYKD